MKDRKAKAPGRYSAIVPVEELEKLQTGNAFEITLARDDDPEVVGTPYNKASVLPDDVAAAICPGVADPTPAEAFAALQANKAPAGYGLGESIGRYVPKNESGQRDLNLALVNGFYQMSDTCINFPDADNPAVQGDATKSFFRYGSIFVESRGGVCSQTVRYDNVFVTRRTINGGKTWSKWLYVNPPFVTDVKYFTTDRMHGKVVIKKLNSSGILVYRLYDEATGEEDSVWKSYLKMYKAAPAGYGLGEETASPLPTNPANIPDLNFAVKSGVYSIYGSYVRNSPAEYYENLKWGTLSVASNGENGVINQCVTYANTIVMRDTKDGGENWSPWAFVNPPFVPGEVYLTTDKINGKQIEKMLNTDGVLKYRVYGNSPWVSYLGLIGAASVGDLDDVQIAVVRADTLAKTNEIAIGEHTANQENPHGITCAQIGAAKASSVESHTTNKSNPHGVTCAQIGAAKAEGEHFAFEDYCERGYCRTINGVKECWVDVERSLSLAATEMNIALPFTPYSGGFSSVQITAGAECASLKPVKDWYIATDDNILTLMFETGPMDELRTTMKLSIYLMSAPKAEG